MTTADSALTAQPHSPIIGRRQISQWVQVTQKQIDSFSDLAQDHQWIHQSNAVEGRGPFGGPIAHGLLILSMALRLAQEGHALPEGAWVLSGFDKIRFRAPVRSGTYIRSSTTPLGLQQIGNRLWLDVSLAVDIEDQSVPALTANCSLMCLKTQGR